MACVEGKADRTSSRPSLGTVFALCGGDVSEGEQKIVCEKVVVSDGGCFPLCVCVCCVGALLASVC